MNARTILLGLMFLPLPLAVSAQAQTPKPATTTHPHPASAADATARKQFAANLAEYRNDPTNADLRDRIIELAKTLKPAPLVPQAARVQYAKAMAQLKAAASPGDDKAAAAAFEQVAAQAPWWADAYLNAATAYAKAGDLSNAKLNLALYNSAVRPGVNTTAADTLQSEIDHQQAEAARQQAQQQFQQALAAFQQNPTDAAREQLIKLAQSMSPAPVVPDDAMNHMARAKAAFEDAKNVNGFKDAIEEFKKASLAAPWLGNIYYDLGVAQDKAGDYADAVKSLNLYLIASPNASDTQKVKGLIYEVQYRKDKMELGVKLYSLNGYGPDYWQQVRALIDQGADVNAKPSEPWLISQGEPILTRAIEQRQWDIAKLVLDKGADVNANNGAALCSAFVSRNGEIVRLLLDKGSEVNQKCVGGVGPPIVAAVGCENSEDIVRLLLDKGADPNATDYQGQTALMFAAQYLQPNMVRLLLDRGVPVNARNNSGQTALQLAEEHQCVWLADPSEAVPCQNNKPEVIRILENAR